MYFFFASMILCTSPSKVVLILFILVLGPFQRMMRGYSVRASGTALRVAKVCVVFVCSLSVLPPAGGGLFFEQASKQTKVEISSGQPASQPPCAP